MTYFLITALVLLSLAAALFALAAYGLHLRAKQATKAANINAGLWAEAEARASIAETDLGRLKAAHSMLQKCYEDMKRIASEAIAAAAERHLTPKPRQPDAGKLDDIRCLTSSYGDLDDPTKGVTWGRSPNFLLVNCLNCSAPIQRSREEFPVRCTCGAEVDILDAGEVSE